MVKIRFLVSLVSLAGLAGCGASDDAADFEPVEELHEEILPAYDRPPAAAVEVRVSNSSKLWVVACDDQHRLRLNISSGNDSWTGWTTLGTNCDDVPTAGRWDFEPNDTVLVYVRDTSDRLIEYWWPDASQTSSFVVSDISGASGIGPITGAPLLVETDTVEDDVISIVVSTDIRNVWTVDWHSGGWHRNKVLMSSGSSTQIKATGNFRALPGGGCTVPGCPVLPTQITGKGLSNSDETTNWTAYRGFLGAGSSVPNFVRVPESDYTASGVGLVYYGSTTYRDAATFTNTLKTRDVEPGAWVGISACSVDGSPMMESKIGYTAGSNGQLFRWLDGFTQQCTKLGGSLTSGPAMVRDGAVFKRYALYRGSARQLFYYNGSTHKGLTLKLP